MAARVVGRAMAAPKAVAEAKVCHPGLTMAVNMPSFLRVRSKIENWQVMGAPWEVLQVIQKGVQPNWPLPDYLSCHAKEKDCSEIALAEKVLQQYLAVGAVKEVHPSGTRHLVPWFIIQKGEGSSEKLRLIADCRELNRFFEPKPFKMDHWHSIFPYLRRGMWAAKIDLKDAYFHLALGEGLRPYVRMQVGPKVYEFQAACFGLSTLPQLWTLVMKVLQKAWRSRGIMCFLYLDDILLVGPTPLLVQRHLDIMLESLQSLGLEINEKKSTLKPVQEIEHLGFGVNFQEGTLQVPVQKLKSIRKELGKLVTQKILTPRKMAAILGSVRSFLMAMPFLRAFTDVLAQFVGQHQSSGWDKKQPVPLEIFQQVKELGSLMNTWQGRCLGGLVAVRNLHSDSSDQAWAGVDVGTGNLVQDFWRERGSLHINVKELHAAVNTVMSLSKAKEKVHLRVDNSVVFSYLTKGGGRIPSLNAIVRPFLKWCMEKQVTLQVTQVKSQDCLADGPSRWFDFGDFTLDQGLFLQLLFRLKNVVQPRVDCFASPGNNKLPKNVSRWPHWGPWEVDALRCPLEHMPPCYAPVACAKKLTLKMCTL